MNEYKMKSLKWLCVGYGAALIAMQPAIVWWMYFGGFGSGPKWFITVLACALCVIGVLFIIQHYLAFVAFIAPAAMEALFAGLMVIGGIFTYAWRGDPAGRSIALAFLGITIFLALGVPLAWLLRTTALPKGSVPGR